ncbi:MAG: DUF4012 domain-containing protein [Actinomycetota bacterium]
MASDPLPSGRWRPRTRRKRVALAVWAGLATFAILLVLDGIWAGRNLARGLTNARSELAVAIESIVTGDPQAAAPHFAAAAEAADSAVGSVGHPSLGLAGLLPVVGDNIEAAEAVAEASRATAEAGVTMVEVARDLGWTDIRIPASTASGALNIEAFETALPAMGSVAARLREAATALESAGGDGVPGPVASGYRDSVEGLSRRADLALRFRDSMQLVTAMFGGQRRYLVCVPSLGVSRPGGGAPAAVGVLVVDDGALELESMTPAPGDLAGIDVSLDWPTTARALMRAAEGSDFDAVDGVILIDTVALQDLVWAIGDVKVKGLPVALSDETTTSALEIEPFLGSNPREAALVHTDRVSRILRAFLQRRPGVESFALATAAGTRSRHLSVYLPGAEEKRLLRSLGLDGRASLKGEGILPVVATWDTLGTSHVAALVKTTVLQSITIRPNGSAAVEAEVLFANGAGTDAPSVLLGRAAGDLPVGSFAADVTLYLPGSAQRIAAETSRPSPIKLAKDLGLATVTGSIAVRGSESTSLTVTYVVPDAVRTLEGAKEIVLRIVPQPSLAGVRYQLSVALPDGSTIVSASPAVERRSDSATFSGVRGGPVDLEIRFGG